MSENTNRAAEYWAEMYRRQREEVPQNEYEKKLLIDLGDGKSITGSIKELKELYGISEDEGWTIYEALKKRCNEWEVRNML